MELSGKISSQRECTRLAAKLGFDIQDMLRWSRSTKPIDALAEEILLEWNARTINTQEGTRSVLCKALNNIGRKDLYNFFMELCGQRENEAQKFLPQGMSDVQMLHLCFVQDIVTVRYCNRCVFVE